VGPREQEKMLVGGGMGAAGIFERLLRRGHFRDVKPSPRSARRSLSQSSRIFAASVSFVVRGFCRGNNDSCGNDTD
jgi:hypothetical protein